MPPVAVICGADVLYTLSRPAPKKHKEFYEL
jgi:hypothetical protein